MNEVNAHIYFALICFLYCMLRLVYCFIEVCCISMHVFEAKDFLFTFINHRLMVVL